MDETKSRLDIAGEKEDQWTWKQSNAIYLKWWEKEPKKQETKNWASRPME